MKPYQWLIAAALFTSASVANANCGTECDPCNSCDYGCNWNFNFSADYLYWKPSRSDLVREGDSVCPDYHSGVRAAVFLPICCWDVGARYTYFQTKNSKHDRKYGIDLDVVDLEAGFTWSLDCAEVNFRPFAGCKLAWLNEKFDGYKVRLKAGGLYLGTGADWHIWDMCDTSVALVTRVAFGALDGVHHVEYNDKVRECWFIPYYEVFAGLSFNMGDFCGINPDVLIGYEAQSWNDLREFDSHNDLGSLGLGGLVVRLGVGF